MNEPQEKSQRPRESVPERRMPRSMVGAMAVVCIAAFGLWLRGDNPREAPNRVGADQIGRYENDLKAEAEAERRVLAMNAEREDYRRSTTEVLVGLARELAALEADTNADANARTGRARLEAEANLDRIRAKQAEVMKEYNAMDFASPATWEDTRHRLDKALSELVTMVHETQGLATSTTRPAPRH